MKNKTFIILIIYILIFGCTTNNSFKEKNIIDITGAIGNSKIHNLSDYAESIKYIPLKTDLNSLVSEIRQIIVEHNIIFILDQSNICKMFDMNGDFIGNIGHIGQGPDEYSYLRSIDIASSPGHLFFNTRDIIEYNNKNVFVRTIKLPQLPDNNKVDYSISLNPDLFVSNIIKYGNCKYSFCTFNSNSEIIDTIPNYEPVEKHGMSGYSSFENVIMYRHNDCIRVYKPLSDTIYTVFQNKKIEQSFIFNWGKYKLPADMLVWRDEIQNYIVLKRLLESSNYIFINLNMGKHAAEPVNNIRSYPDGRKVEFIDNTTYALFNKEKGELNLLNQPTNKKFGFHNNIDNGPVIWPEYITSKDELISYVQPDDFISMYEQCKSPSKEMKYIATKIATDDNPIVIITSLKQSK